MDLQLKTIFEQTLQHGAVHHHLALGPIGPRLNVVAFGVNPGGATLDRDFQRRQALTGCEYDVRHLDETAHWLAFDIEERRGNNPRAGSGIGRDVDATWFDGRHFKERRGSEQGKR